MAKLIQMYDSNGNVYPKSKISATSLLNQKSIPTTATSYSCAWSGYDFIIIESIYNGDVHSQLVIPTSWFAGTTSTTRVILSEPIADFYYVIYANGNNAIYARGSVAASDTYGIKIWGVNSAT